MAKYENYSLHRAHDVELRELVFQSHALSVEHSDFNSGASVDDPQHLSLDPYAGGTFRDLPILDLEGVIGQIDSGREIQAANGVITYTFLDNRLIGLYNNPNYGFGAGDGLAPFTQEQREEARDSIQLWDDLVPQSFRETNGLGADIQFSNSQDPAQAYAYYPTTRGWRYESDVFIADPRVNWSNAWLGFGGYGATTLVHELGHALGLSHPGAYNYDPDLDLTYANYAEYAQDSEQYTIMSYWGMEQTSRQVFAGGIVDFGTLFYNNPQTPLVHDILTIQAKYGADPTTRSGDTVYGWNSTAGNEVYDFEQNPFPYLSIYDAGGVDTIDMSGAGAGVFINLNDGSFSSGAAAIPDAVTVNANRAELDEIVPGTLGQVSQATMDYYASVVPTAYANIIAGETGVAGVRTTSHDNLSIAYGTIIENAIGSEFRDYLLGNDVDNVLTGLGGDDELRGGEGNDTLVGGLGADRLTGGNGADLFVIDDAGSTDTIVDFESGSDQIDLSAFDFTFVGDAAFSNSAGELRFENGQLQGDLDGDGIADLFVNVGGDPIVTTDLVL